MAVNATISRVRIVLSRECTATGGCVGWGVYLPSSSSEIIIILF